MVDHQIENVGWIRQLLAGPGVNGDASTVQMLSGQLAPQRVDPCRVRLEQFDAQIRSMEPDAISFAHLPDDCKTPKELKERYGDQVTLIGYISTPLLVTGTPQEVMTACREQIDVLSRDGGFILAPGCEYPPNIPLTNAFSIMKAAEKYG